jgi:hypothetical protein
VRQGGFLSLGLYVVIALGAATLIAGGFASCEHRARKAAEAETARVQGRFDVFTAEVQRRGEEAQAEKEAIEKRWRGVLSDVKARSASDLRDRDAALARLRARPPARPDASPVPVIAECSGRTDAASGELVPLADYRALEARAYDDALRLTRLQEWVILTGHPVE